MPTKPRLDSDEFETNFQVALRKTQDTDSSWLAMYALRVIDREVMQEWAKWAVVRLGDKPITADTLREACLGPTATAKKLSHWVFDTDWGIKAAIGLRGRVDSAALLGMVLLNLSEDDWSAIAEYMA